MAGAQGMQAEPRKKGPTPQRFEVEFGDSNCRNFIIVNLDRLRVRGAWSVAKMSQRPEGARELGNSMVKMPSIPGQRLQMQFHDDGSSRVVIYDPLENDPQTVERVNNLRKEIPALIGADWGATEKIERDLDQDRTVTLLFELVRMAAADKLKVTKGELPTPDQIKNLPGEELWDPGDTMTNHHRYKTDYQQWLRQRLKPTSD